jgi:hypothetical protein
LANWRISSISTSPQPTKDSPTSADSEEGKTPQVIGGDHD